MQAVNNSNISRSKINKLNLPFLIAYFSKILYINTTNKLIAERSATISFLFNTGLAYTPQGRVFVKVPLKSYKVGLKFGMFAATKKPFNFRPKKKKQKR